MKCSTDFPANFPFFTADSHIFSNGRHTKCVAILFVLLAVTAALAFLTAPLPVKARVYLTLDGFRLHVRLRIAGIVPVHAKIVIRRGEFVATLNGKKFPKKKRRKGKSDVAKAVCDLLREGVVKGGGATLYVGGADGAVGALCVGAINVLSALFGRRGRTEVYWNENRPTFVFDGGVQMRISIMQTLSAVTTARSRAGATDGR